MKKKLIALLLCISMFTTNFSIYALDSTPTIEDEMSEVETFVAKVINEFSDESQWQDIQYDVGQDITLTLPTTLKASVQENENIVEENIEVEWIETTNKVFSTIQADEFVFQAKLPQDNNYQTASNLIFPSIKISVKNKVVSVEPPTLQTPSTPIVYPTNQRMPSTDGLNLSKKATKVTDKEYNLTLEAYTTGFITTNTETQLLDIVMVLDQSGSMNETFTNGSTKNSAMVEAAKNFITSVSKNSKEHRIGLVQFGQNSKILNQLTMLNGTGKKQLNSTLSSLYPNGATPVDEGMQQAINVFNTNPSQKRKKVVVVFTDGHPSKRNSFKIEVANDAITNAKTLKSSGVDIYSIGIFDNAHPSQVAPTKQLEEVGSVWPFDSDDIAANRFMNYLSSNSSDATSLGLSKQILTYSVTHKFEWQNKGYYLTATNKEGLNNVFEKISQSIITPTIDLNEKTVLKDFIASDFIFPIGFDANNITTQVATIKTDADVQNIEDTSWNNPVIVNDLQVTIDASRTGISVTGFNYNENTIVENNGVATGKKLIVTIPIEVAPDCLGGDNLPTNTDQSAIYNEFDELVKPFEIPTVTILYKLTNLTLKKSGIETIDENQSIIFSIKGVKDSPTKDIDLTVVLQASDNWSVTIKDLPVGDYMIHEDSNWSWRYELVAGEEIDRHVHLSGTSNEVVYTNQRSKDKWLNGSSYCENKWVDNTIKASKNGGIN